MYQWIMLYIMYISHYCEMVLSIIIIIVIFASKIILNCKLRSCLCICKIWQTLNMKNQKPLKTESQDNQSHHNFE